MTKFPTAATACAGAAALVLAGCGEEKLATPKVPRPPTQSQLVDAASNGIVAIKVRSQSGVFTGTGFVSGPREIITADHVVQGAKNIKIRFKDGTVVPARVEGGSACGDNARLVLTEDVPNLTILPMANGKLLEPSSPLTVLHYGGNAAQRSGREGLTATPVTVANPRVVNSDLGPSFPRFADMIHLQGALTPGSSGAPPLTQSGQVAGMVVVGVPGESEAYALPSGQLRQALPELRLGKRKESIGAELESVRTMDLRTVFRADPDYARYGSILGRIVERYIRRTGETGLYVQSVEANGPSAGKLAYGYMITRVNGVRIRSMRGYCGVLQSASPGERLTLSGISINAGIELTDVLMPWTVRVKLDG